MSIRIFELAKQLSQESKVIIAACKALGLRGDKKFYIFTSLNEEEERRVVEYVANQDKASSSSGRGASKAFVEEDKSFTPLPPKPTIPTGKLRIIQPARGRLSEVDQTVRTHLDVNELVNNVPVSTVPVVEPSKEEPSVVVSSGSGGVVGAADEIKNAETEPTLPSASESNVAGETSDNVVPPEDAASHDEDVTSNVDLEEDKRQSHDEQHETETQPVPAREAEKSDGPETRPEINVDGTAGTEKKVLDGSASPSTEEQAPAPSAPVRKAPLHDVLTRREASGSSVAPKNDARSGSRRQRDRDRDSGGRHAPRGAEPQKPLRPAPVTSSFISQLEQDAQNMSAMAPPPPMTSSSANSRVRVLGQPQRKKDDAGDSTRNLNKGHEVAVHLAPMPVQPVKTPKVEKEPAAQKPEMRLTPEALRSASGGASGPLMKHLRSATDRTASSGGAKTDRREGGTRSGDSRFGRGDLNEERERGDKGKKKSGRDRDEGSREDKRGAKVRRGGNDQRYRSGEDEDDRYSRSMGTRTRRDKTARTVVTAPRKNDVVIELPCTTRQFAEATGLSVAVVIKKLMEFEVLAPQNSPLDVDVINLLIDAFELKATIKKEATLEELYVDSAYDQEDPPETLKPRAPVVTFLGHVDHGKTSLLDRILNLHVVSGESGGITQHIRAYQIVTEGGPVTFVDTPGHEAFTAMRARGANCTDIAVLVVAADDGVMPQTEEAISHAKAAGVPIVVALNKMDLPGVNPDKVVQELASNDLMPSEWGGDVEIVHTSAITGMGVDKLLETLLLVAELNELKANPDRPAMGVVLESSLQQGEGVLCKALVQKGTLRRGDVVLCGSSYGRVRAMTDTMQPSKRIKEAGPSCPVTISGLDTPPEAGSKFVVLEDVTVARQIAEERQARSRELELANSQSHVTLESLFERIKSARTEQTLNVIIRADVRGSIEAIRKELGKLEHPEVKVKVLQASVGGITEADVHLADASDAIIVGFNVVPEENARALAEAKKVQIRRYDVIYKLTEDIRAALEGMLKPIEQVKELGRAVVQRAFNISRVGVIAGCRVIYGVIERDCKVRVIRDSRIIGDYPLETLKREKDDVREVREGYECGMKLKNFNDVKEGDVLEAYKIEEVARSFDETSGR